MYNLDILFRQITIFIKVYVAIISRLQALLLIDFTKTYQLKGLEPKTKGHTNFYEYCDLTKKYIKFSPPVQKFKIQLFL